MPGLNLHQYWRRPVATCTGLPLAVPFERLYPPVPVANSDTKIPPAFWLIEVNVVHRWENTYMYNYNENEKKITRKRKRKEKEELS